MAGRCSKRDRQAEARPVGQELWPRRSTKGCSGGLDFLKDDENINSQAFMHWRDRFLFSMEAVNRAQAETGEVKGHYLNVTAGTMEDMYERAEFAKELRSCIVMIDLVIGWTAIQSMSTLGAQERHDPASASRGARHVHAAAQSRHFVSRDLRSGCALAGVDHAHAGTAVGKLEGDPLSVQGYYNVCRERATKSTCRAAFSSISRGPACAR